MSEASAAGSELATATDPAAFNSFIASVQSKGTEIAENTAGTTGTTGGAVARPTAAVGMAGAAVAGVFGAAMLL